MSMPEVCISAGGGTAWLMGKQYPYRDSMPLSVSGYRYDGGGQFGVEIPAVNSLAELELTIGLLQRRGVEVTRFDETLGSFLLSDTELCEMFELCRSTGHGILISLGPRPEYDVKASFYRTSFGPEQGRRVNNNDAIRVCAEEAVRLAELGCRGITVYDIGILRVLSEMRADWALPADLILKTSTHCMAANPFLARIFAENGADSVTVNHDLGLPVLHEMRRLSPELPLDVPTDVYRTKGGFIRFYELAEIVQVASPVMLKMGASVQGHPYDAASERMTRERVDRVARGLDIMSRFLPEASRISEKSRHRCIPATDSDSRGARSS